MTKKDYIKLADMIRRIRVEYRYADLATLDEVADRLCSILKYDNPAFDAGRFMAACQE